MKDDVSLHVSRALSSCSLRVARRSTHAAAAGALGRERELAIADPQMARHHVEVSRKGGRETIDLHPQDAVKITVPSGYVLVLAQGDYALAPSRRASTERTCTHTDKLRRLYKRSEVEAAVG
jgi:hypothetical protein